MKNTHQASHVWDKWIILSSGIPFSYLSKSKVDLFSRLNKKTRFGISTNLKLVWNVLNLDWIWETPELGAYSVKLLTKKIGILLFGVHWWCIFLYQSFDINGVIKLTSTPWFCCAVCIFRGKWEKRNFFEIGKMSCQYYYQLDFSLNIMCFMDVILLTCRIQSGNHPVCRKPTCRKWRLFLSHWTQVLKNWRFKWMSSSSNLD